MKVLTIDVGGHHVKMLATDQQTSREFESGPDLTPQRMIQGVREATDDWQYEAASVGYPGPVLHGRIVSDPVNLGKGWVGFDFEKALGCPVKVVNDAAMQALGSYEGGKMLFLGLGTGLGSAMIVDGLVEPMELGHLPYQDRTYEDYVGERGREQHGEEQWRRDVAEVVKQLKAALLPDYIVLGGGNVERLETLPPDCRPGDNDDAFSGGFRLWQEATSAHRQGGISVR